MKSKIKSKKVMAAAAGTSDAPLLARNIELSHPLILDYKLNEARTHLIGNEIELQYAVILMTGQFGSQGFVKNINVLSKKQLQPTVALRNLTDVQTMQCHYYKALFSNDPKMQLNFAQKAFDNCIDALKSKPKLPKMADGSSSITNHEMVIPQLMNLVVFCTFIERDENIKLIEEVLIRLDKKDSLATFYQNLSCYFNDTCAYRKAIEYGLKALETAEGTEHDSGLLYYNLGMANVELNIELALDYYQKANALIPNDIETLRGIWTVHKYLYDYKGAMECVRAFASDHRAVMTLQTQLFFNKITNEVATKKATGIKKPVDKNFYAEDYYALTSTLSTQSGKIAEAGVATSKLISALSARPVHIIQGLKHTLGLLIQNCQFEQGVTLLEQKKSEYNFLNNSLDIPSLKYCEFILYENSDHYDQATIALQALQAMGGTGQYFSKLPNYACSTRFYTDIERRDFAAAKAIAKFTLYSDEFVEAVIAKIHSEAHEIISEEQEGTASADKGEDQNLLDAIIDSLSDTKNECASFGAAADEAVTAAASSAGTFAIVDSTSADLFEFFAGMSGREIDQHFKRKKAALAKASPDKILSGEQPTSWDLGATKRNSNEECVYKIKGLDNFYGYIDASLKIDHELFEGILDKGLAGRAKGRLGVKPFGGCFELKIKGDYRVWAEDIYVNPEGFYLLAFAADGRHKAAAKAARICVKPQHVDFDRSWDSSKLVPIAQSEYAAAAAASIDEQVLHDQSGKLGSGAFTDQLQPDFSLKIGGEVAIHNIQID